MKKSSNVTSLSGHGLRDWLIQRMTSVVMLFYIIFLFGFFFTHVPMTYETWHHFFMQKSVAVFSSLFLLSLMWHAWIGMWTIITDYIKPFVLRLAVEIFVIVGLLLYFIWGLAIFWGH